MRCTTLSLALLLFVSQLSATDGHALQLRWTTGETNLNSWAGRCTLVVDAGQLEQMPRGWELVWSSDDGDLRVVPADPTARCDSSVAQVQDVSIATDIFGFQEHRTYAEFCSEAAGAATSAWFVVEFPDTARATFKIVALDPTDPDSQRVIQSGVTTLNGGATTSLPPVILRSRYTHGATAFTLDLVGAGLVSPRLVRLMGPSQDWSSPLTVTESSDTSLRAVGSFAALIPECAVHVIGAAAIATSSLLAAEPEPEGAFEPSTGGSCALSYTESLVRPGDPNALNIQPKDFAFIHGWTPDKGWAFHLFYIRRDLTLQQLDTEKTIGHAYIPQAFRATMNGWTMDVLSRDLEAIKARPDNPGAFDYSHVWAPHIVQVGLEFRMFYTGVDAQRNESIGFATSTDLFHWTQPAGPVLSMSDLGVWAFPDGREGHNELRDPFVMKNPDNPAQWLMYYATVSDVDTDRMLIGMSTSTDMITWSMGVPFYSTLNPQRERVESPFIVERQGKWWLMTTESQDDPPLYPVDIFASGNAVAPTDTTVVNWSERADLEHIVKEAFYNVPVSDYQYWKGFEYLSVPAGTDSVYQIIAGYNDLNVGVDYVTVFDELAPGYLWRERCPTMFLGVASNPGAGPAFSVVRRTTSECTFQWTSPTARRVTLVAYDIAGRRMSKLVERQVAAGRSEFAWNYRSASGQPVPSGVYFIRAESDDWHRAIKIAVVR